MYDQEDSTEQYERIASPTMPYLVLMVLVLVVSLIAGLAVWTSA